MEMTQEREASILEGAIDLYGKIGIRAIASDRAAVLVRSITSNYHESHIKRAIADMSVALNMLEMIYGDCTEEEIASLESLEGRLNGR